MTQRHIFTSFFFLVFFFFFFIFKPFFSYLPSPTLSINITQGISDFFLRASSYNLNLSKLDDATSAFEECYTDPNYFLLIETLETLKHFSFTNVEIIGVAQIFATKTSRFLYGTKKILLF